MKLYYHRTDGGAEYLMDTYIKCDNGHKEGRINDKTKYVVRIDGDITKDVELDIRSNKIHIDPQTGAKLKHCITCGQK